MIQTKIHDAKSLHTLFTQLPHDTFIVGLFINLFDVSQDEWLNPLARTLNAKGFTTIGITTPQSTDKCDLSSTQYQAIVNLEELKSLGRINVFIFSDMDWDCDYPKTSKTLGCCHGFITGRETSLPYSFFLGSKLDGWMLSMPLNETSRKNITSQWRGLLNQELSHRQSSRFHIIPVGYPRLAVLSQKLHSVKRLPDSIIYAPIGKASAQDQGGERIKNHGRRIIRTLLEYFPQMNVIFRPYKTDIDLPEVQEILGAFANENRFIFDADPGRAFSFSRGAVLITDLSHIAQTFAFSTLRPAIRFLPWDKNKKNQELDDGRIVYAYTALVESIKDGLLRANEWREKIRKNREKLAVPFENALEHIADWINDFYNDKPRPEWVSIERCQPEKMLDEKAIIQNILRQTESAIPTIAASAANFSLPDNPLLMALALHTGLIYTPGNRISHGRHVCAAISRLLGKRIFNIPHYKEINPEYVRKLYNMGLLEMIRKKDSEGIALVEQLLADFNRSFPA